MGKMIYVSQKCKNPKKKPGWQEAQKQEQEWLAGLNSMRLFSQPGRKYKGASVVVGKKVEVVKDGNLAPRAELEKGSILPAKYTTMSGTKSVSRPEIEYRDNPELVEREKAARARKFNTAPAYNKGPDIFVTEEELANQLRGNKRRP